MKIYPADYDKSQEASGELVIDDNKEKEMIAKTIELLGDEPKESRDLMDLVEAHYVGEGEHYTSKQLKDIVVKADLEMNPPPPVPEPVEEVPEEVTPE